VLHDVVKAGKVRYVGASSMWAWQFAKMQDAADLGGWTRFVSMQDQYNLLKREEEREMLPMCAEMGVGCIPYSPLGKGRLARPWGEHTQRGDTDQVAKSFYLDVDQPVVEAVLQVAGERGCRWRRSASPGCSASLWSPPPSSEPPSRTIWPTPPRRSRSGSPMTRSAGSSSPIRLSPPTGGERPPTAGGWPWFDVDPSDRSTAALRPLRDQPGRRGAVAASPWPRHTGRHQVGPAITRRIRLCIWVRRVANGSVTPLLSLASSYRSLLRFDTSGVSPSATVSPATLRVFSTVGLTSGGVQVHPEADGWDEATTTWADQPAWNATVLATSTTPTGPGWLSIALSASAVIAGGNTSVGLSYSVSGVIDRLASREDPTNPPQLVITTT
jgi:hypothetical protein